MDKKSEEPSSPTAGLPELVLAKSESSTSPGAGFKQEEIKAAEIKQEDSEGSNFTVKKEENMLTPDAQPSEEDSFEAALVASAEKAEKAQQHANQLKDKFKDLIDLLQKAMKEETKQKIDRSNYGHAKKRRLMSSQIAYSYRLNGEDDYNDYIDYKHGGYSYGYESDGSSDFDSEDFFLASAVSSLFQKFCSVRAIARSSISDCDCGRPHVLIAGQHTCRYFGKFQCSCGNAWTSAYTWKGEAQACRSCNRESLPVRKEKLKGGKGHGVGAHDSSRCTMCKKLGRNCSRGSFY